MSSDGVKKKGLLGHLNEVGIEPSQQHSFKQLILVAVLVVERIGTLAVAGTGHQLGFVQVLAELRDETCSGAAQRQKQVKK